MNKKITSGLLILLGLVALVALFGTENPASQFVRNKHAKKSHEGVDPGCPASDAYTEQCENAGGKVCGKNSFGRFECCHTVDGDSTCESHKFGFWGHYKYWKSCENQLEVGACP